MLNLHDIFTNIANAIREKTGSSELMHPVDMSYEISQISGGGGDQAQLYAPLIDLGPYSYLQDLLYIYNNASNGAFCQYYDIYANNVLVKSVEHSATTIAVDLRSCITIDGTYSVVVKARGANMTDSTASTAVSYIHYTYVSVAMTLSHCTSTNEKTMTYLNYSYSTTLEMMSGYSFVGASVTVTMGGVDITSTAYDSAGNIYIETVTDSISITATYVEITQLATPTNISLSGDILSWNAVQNAASYGIYANNALKATIDATSCNLTTIDFGVNNLYDMTVTAIANGYIESNQSSVVSYSYMEGVAPDPILENNDWATIKATCQSGMASNYWSLGDVKTIPYTYYGHTYNARHMLVDMTPGRYRYANRPEKTTNVVFQCVDVYTTNNKFNAALNTSPNGDGAYNGYFYCELRTKQLLPSASGSTIYNCYPSDFKALLESVETYQAYSGKTNELHYQNDVLFMPAAPEVRSSSADSVKSYVQSCELSIAEFGFYAQNNDADANRKVVVVYPGGSSNIVSFTLRSSTVNTTFSYCIVAASKIRGDIYTYSVSERYGISASVCFAW